MRVLAIDPGQRRVGLAVTDEGGTIALPLATIERRDTRYAITEIARHASERRVSRLVMGLPLRMDGTDGLQARTVRIFGAAVSQQTGLEVIYWDERLTTAQAHRALQTTGRSTRDRREVIDQAAAVILLQSYLAATATRDDG